MMSSVQLSYLPVCRLQPPQNNKPQSLWIYTIQTPENMMKKVISRQKASCAFTLYYLTLQFGESLQNNFTKFLQIKGK